MHFKAILPPRMTRLRCMHAAAALAVMTCWVPPASAQYGTPEEWRRSTPTIQDRDPGVAAPAEAEMDPAYRRQPVFYRSAEAPGTIIIDTSDRFLYLIQPNKVALRYGI